ncbi:DUF6514 family protein [Clostridium cylindrosporum]|uniref:Uncharacterized protein n=1 Tax=Clostridium cylindrosporum DSM 605 TaxID=1121307 RepID=A0A0J8FZY6_CLOCY|nr:DUF6514 family protein [Clostridium cylindrosporum]KMT21116.1 hypothetical protein CLCY_1c03500 [Clostridium cylindrosporum DSM 605]
MVKIEIESRDVASADREYTYKYYLTMSKNENDFEKKVDVYGIEVSAEGIGFEYFVSKTIADFTASKEYAVKTIKQLSENEASPLHFIDILSDSIDVYIEYTYENRKCL